MSPSLPVSVSTCMSLYQLGANLRHVRVFEMDVEDEEDEDRGESTNTSVDKVGLDDSLASQGGAGAQVGAGGQEEGVGGSEESQLEAGEALEIS